MPGWLVDDLRAMYAHFGENGLVATDDELAELFTLLGRQPRSYESWVKEVAEQWV